MYCGFSNGIRQASQPTNHECLCNENNDRCFDDESSFGLEMMLYTSVQLRSGTCLPFSRSHPESMATSSELAPFSTFQPPERWMSECL
jgi:hypothetical protein